MGQIESKSENWNQTADESLVQWKKNVVIFKLIYINWILPVQQASCVLWCFTFARQLIYEMNISDGREKKTYPLQ